MDCGGRAGAATRFRADEALWISNPSHAGESGVALRFPPQSKIALSPPCLSMSIRG